MRLLQCLKDLSPDKLLTNLVFHISSLADTVAPYMRAILRTLLFIAVTSLVACANTKSRDFFAANGITVGDPVKVKVGTYRIPISFETEIVHSGQWIDTTKAKIDGSDIQVTAIFTNANRKSRYPGYIEVNGARAGVYTLKYLDQDGTLHTIKSVTLP